MYIDRQTAKLLKVTSKGESRGMLQGVHMTPDYAEATDGHILVRVPHPTCATPRRHPPTGNLWLLKPPPVKSSTLTVLPT